MIKVTVLDTPIRNMKGVGKTSGKPYDLDFQTIWLHTVSPDGTVSPFPEKTEIILDRDQLTGKTAPYPAGEYTLHPSSIRLGQSGNPEVALRLAPLKKPA
jgi:hypothetical protein